MTSTEENYIKAVYHLSGREKRMVNTNAIAAHLNTSAASVTDMLRKLSQKQITLYEKYKGAKLSKKGEKLAIHLIRRHRLWEVFLVEKLNFAWDEIHEIAEHLEHIKSTKLIDKLESYLGSPKVDPHGDPIPDKNGKITYQSQTKLSDLKENDKCIVVGVSDTSAEFLKFLDSQKIALGCKIDIINRFDYDGTLTVKIGKLKKITLSKVVAKNLFVTLI